MREEELESEAKDVAKESKGEQVNQIFSGSACSSTLN